MSPVVMFFWVCGFLFAIGVDISACLWHEPLFSVFSFLLLLSGITFTGAFLLTLMIISFLFFKSFMVALLLLPLVICLKLMRCCIALRYKVWNSFK